MLSVEEQMQRLQRALDESDNRYTIEDVFEKLRNGDWQIHQRGDGVVITSLFNNVLGERLLDGILIYGDMDDVLSMSDDIDQFARDMGCTKFVMHGRLGWQRVLKNFGWKPTGIMMEKTL